jgi:hypothetical protein
MDISGFPKGTYLIRLILKDDQVITGRFTKGD